jgi:predicted phosphodiesterase
VLKLERLLSSSRIRLGIGICLLVMASQSEVAAKKRVADGAKDVTLVLWGDSRENADNAAVHTLKVLREDIKDWDIMVHTGDFTSDGSAKTWERSLGYQGMREAFVKGKFFMCTSNHDRVEDAYDRYTKGVLPVNTVDHTTHFYHHQQGHVHLFFCDGQFTDPAVVNKWLEAELKKVPRDDWIIGVWHAPCYGDVTYKGSHLKACQAWLDTLYRHGGDLVFHGHAHSYVRTHPLTPSGTQDLKRGMVHIVNGTGGASFKKPVKKVARTAFTPTTKSFPTVTMIRFKGHALELKTIDTRPGKKLAVIDAWTWQKHPKGRQVQN